MISRPLLVSIALGWLACSAKRDEFCDKVFKCDLNAVEDPCGKSCRGKPMTCYAGSQLGGDDFCAETCDPAQGSDDPAFTCTTSRALLRICHPQAEATDPSKGCPAGLECYRTDLLNDDGVCMALHVCKTNDECAGAQRNICAATIVEQLSGHLPTLDHLQCLQQNCSPQAQCSSGEVCLADYYFVNETLPVVCVPKCDGDLHCPPNFTCAAAASGAGSQAICLPGLPGGRCVDDQDCLIGSCFDTGAGFSECVPPISCTSDLSCAPFNTTTIFVCVQNAQTGKGVCLSTTPFHGANCNETADAPNGHCPDGQVCNRYSPWGPGEIPGECRVPCDGAQQCPAIGGIPHVCLASGAGGCYPTGFAMPCTTSAECLPEFSCLPVSPDERTVITSPTICTMPCADDGECRANPLITTNGFCKTPEEGLCRLSGWYGDPCERDEECRAGVCRLDQSGQYLCQPGSP